MPEGHTVHRMAKDHAKLFRGQTVELSSPQGRFADGAQRLNGSVFRGASAHGKHLFYHLDRPDQPAIYIHIHLGLFGKFRRRKDETPPSPNCRLRIRGDASVLDLSGPTCCEVLTAEGVEQKRAKLGPDPLRQDGDVQRFVERLARRRIPIAAALLDQKVIAGLGNIYRAELLFEHGIDPMTPASALAPETALELWDTAVWWLALGVRANRIITVFSEPPKRLPRLPRREAVMVYGRSECIKCGGAVETRTVGNRKLFACFECQVRRR